MARRRFLLRTITGIALAAVLVIGLLQATGGDGGDQKSPELPPVSKQQQQLEGAPAPIAALHARAGDLLEGSVRDRLETLRGHPVVVNKWASWCGPCRLEFPVVGKAALNLGKRVAFIGLDSDDTSRSGARKLLDQFPVSYPSYLDPSKKQAEALGIALVFPTTLFIGRGGETAYIHQGPYEKVADLERDVARYLGVPRK